MTRKYKIDRGDWVVLRAANQATARPGKVLSADGDGVTVSFRFDNGPRELRYEGDGLDLISRIRWERGRDGRRRWKLAA